MISDEPRVLLRAERLSKDCRLGSKREAAVSNLDIKIMQGEFLIVEGLCGIQKNAFFNLLGCLERPDLGKYFFDYEDIALASTKLLDELRRNKIGYLFRDFNLIPRMSVSQNLEVPLMGVGISRQEKKDRVRAALEKLELLELSEEKAGALSDFNKQMVSLARAIVNNPLMILADEPAANLGSKEEQLLMKHLNALNGEGVTIILITEKANIRDLDIYRLITFEGGKLCSDKDAHKLSLVRREA